MLYLKCLVSSGSNPFSQQFAERRAPGLFDGIGIHFAITYNRNRQSPIFPKSPVRMLGEGAAEPPCTKCHGAFSLV